MALPVPKPDMRQVVAVIHEHTRLARIELERKLGPLNLDAELVLQQIVARAVEWGIDAQREAFLSAPELLPTPIRPPPSEVPLPKPPKLPKGVG